MKNLDGAGAKFGKHHMNQDGSINVTANPGNGESVLVFGDDGNPKQMYNPTNGLAPSTMSNLFCLWAIENGELRTQFHAALMAEKKAMDAGSPALDENTRKIAIMLKAMINTDVSTLPSFNDDGEEEPGDESSLSA